MLKKILKLDGKTSILGVVKRWLPLEVTNYLDDLVVLGIVGGYIYGKVSGVEVFTENVLLIAVAYALSKELNI